MMNLRSTRGVLVVVSMVCLIAGLSCSDDKCTAPPPSEGACCLPDYGSCLIATRVQCEEQGGYWGGTGSVCLPNPCPPEPKGACCFRHHPCRFITEADCLDEDGDWLGMDIPCTPNCPPPTPSTGTISGTVQLRAGISGDLRNSRVAIYASLVDWNNDRVLRQVTAQGTEFSVSFTFTNVTPGSYYLDIWKDTDNSGTINNGDFFGVHGTSVWPNPTLAPLLVQAGQVTTTNIFAVRVQ